MKRIKNNYFCFIGWPLGLVLSVLLFCLKPAFCRAMPPGTLLYRTSGDGQLFAYSSDSLLSTEKGIIKNIYSGHAAIYIGREDGVDYIVEALADGIVKTPAKYFVNRGENESFLGAKIPRDLSPIRQAKVVAIAKSLVGKNLAYDYDFKDQKGPLSGQWTCVGLTEKLYESADISNPNNLSALEYDSNYYAIDITPDGYDNKSVVNAEGDCFARQQEYSKIARRSNLLVPAPELIGYDLGREYNGERYIFLPYTQFLQKSLEPVTVDIEISSYFAGSDIRGSFNAVALALRWSLINNPLSSVKTVAVALKDSMLSVLDKTKTLAQNVGEKIFGSDQGSSIVLTDELLKKETASVSDLPVKKLTVNKATIKTSVSKPVSSKATLASPTIKINKAEQSVRSTNTVKTTTTVATYSKTPVLVASSGPALIAKTESKKSSETTAKPVAATTPAPVYYSPIVYSNPAPLVAASTEADNFPKLALINKIYATEHNDFIELLNTGDHDFDLAEAGYRLEKAKTADDPSLMMRIGNADDGSYPGGTVIKAHGRYLIVGAQADDFYRAQADAIISRESFSWPGSAYTIYLGRAAISSSADPDIVDAVGFGPDATYFLGSGPAPEISDNYILNRVDDSEDNQNDFSLSPAADPAALAALAILAANSGDQTNTATSSVNNNTEDDEDNNEDDDEEDNPNEEDNQTESPENTDSPSSASSSAFALINKVYATGDNDFIELFNPTDYDLDLAATTYRLQKTKTALNPGLLIRFDNPDDALYPGGKIIKAHDKYLIVRDDASSFFLNQADAIATRDEFTWSGSGYTFFLGNDPVASSTDINILDTLGFGPDATYFLGNGPAPEITDNYVLNRIAMSGNNNTDFNLILSDDPSIAPAASSTIELDANLFVAPTPIISESITDLWHFSECHGAGHWTVGQWDCGQIIGPPSDSFNAELKAAVNLNNLSLSFYYKKTSDFSRLNVDLFNDDDDKISLILEKGLITVEGLPNSDWRYYLDPKFDDDWHRADLIINQSADYWALYIDGQEFIKENFFANLLPLMTNVAVRGDGYPVLFDELVLWQRSLSSEEILQAYLADAPYGPVLERENQKLAALFHLWNFQEDAGSLATDNINNATIGLSPELWVGRSHNNYAIKTGFGQEFLADLAEINSRDFSLALWWRNSSYPGESRVFLNLLDASANKTSFAANINYYRIEAWLGGSYTSLSEGIDKAIPYDDLWHHLALVYDSYRYKLRFYVDGEEKASSSMIWLENSQNINRLRIYMEGLSSELDDLAIYEGALSPTQVQEIYQNSQ